MPITPPHVRTPTTGADAQPLDRRGDDVAVGAGQLVGQRDDRAARRVVGVGARLPVARGGPSRSPCAPASPPPAATCARRVAAHVEDQPVAGGLPAQVTVQLRPAGGHHVGHVQVAEPCPRSGRRRTPAARPPSPGSAARLVRASGRTTTRRTSPRPPAPARTARSARPARPPARRAAAPGRSAGSTGLPPTSRITSPARTSTPGPDSGLRAAGAEVSGGSTRGDAPAAVAVGLQVGAQQPGPAADQSPPPPPPMT